MAVKFSYEKYTYSGENSSRFMSVWCEQLCKPYRIFSGNSSIFKWQNRKISNSKRAKYYGH